MLSEYPEVRPLFNQAHQVSGDQPRALANGVLMYARHIDRLEALGPLVAQIVNKHVSLQILPEHYPIVGSCLLRAIREVLGAEIATDVLIIEDETFIAMDLEGLVQGLGHKVLGVARTHSEALALGRALLGRHGQLLRQHVLARRASGRRGARPPP